MVLWVEREDWTGSHAFAIHGSGGGRLVSILASWTFKTMRGLS